jgi:hypothetical protein
VDSYSQYNKKFSTMSNSIEIKVSEGIGEYRPSSRACPFYPIFKFART